MTLRGVATKDTVAIIDIGSNSVRLVVYAGAPRVRDPIFNEKVLAGLGKKSEDGKLPPKSRDRAMVALRRFKLLLDQMKVSETHVLATAAVRDAADGADFAREVRSIGLPCRILSAEEEAELAGLGVLYGMPGADGIVGDLGGGSLELVEVSGGKTGIGLSMPIGVLKIEANSDGRKAARKVIRQALATSGLGTSKRPLYLVGGSWRSLARVDMALTGYPLPITHCYRMAPGRTREIAKVTASASDLWMRAAPTPRHATAPVSAMILDVLAEELEPSRLVVSASGIREGLMFAGMKSAVRRLDPLIEAARHLGEVETRFGQHGEQLDAWMDDLFDDEPPALRRLRLTACLLADVAWQANAPFRAQRAIETALHGNWVGIDARGRVLLAQALASSFGDAGLPDAKLYDLCDPADIGRAHLWGLAIRLGQRLSAGVGAILRRAPLIVQDDGLAIELRVRDQALAGEAVATRLKKLAEAVGMAVDA